MLFSTIWKVKCVEAKLCRANGATSLLSLKAECAARPNLCHHENVSASFHSCCFLFVFQIGFLQRCAQKVNHHRAPSQPFDIESKIFSCCLSGKPMAMRNVFGPAIMKNKVSVANPRLYMRKPKNFNCVSTFKNAMSINNSLLFMQAE